MKFERLTIDESEFFVAFPDRHHYSDHCKVQIATQAFPTEPSFGHVEQLDADLVFQSATALLRGRP
jgi:hypothetical protein